MFWTIIAPELVLAWAVRQWFAAWEIRDTVNGTHEGELLVAFICSLWDANNEKLAGFLREMSMTIRRWFGNRTESSKIAFHPLTRV